MDADTGTVLFAKDPDRRLPPASMSKIMTIYLVFERLKEGRLSLDDLLPVSEKAWRMGGSKMFVEVGNQVRVEDLIRGVVVQSGNDASIVLAEGLSGSEGAFAEDMNRRADEMGLTNSHFVNSTGWPDPDQYMSARDLALLAWHLIKDFSEYYHYFGELEFVWHDIKQANRNPLLYRNVGADGLKTGHTEEAGYCLTASAERDGRRLVLVITGLGSMKERGEEAERLLEWGFREFENLKLFAAGEKVEEAETWMGTPKTVPLVPQQDVLLTVSREARQGLQATVVYDGPLQAPIAAGQRVATLTLTAPGIETKEIPLVTGSDVARLGPFGRIFVSARYMLLGER